jgi:hypothetical protein
MDLYLCPPKVDLRGLSVTQVSHYPPDAVQGSYWLSNLLKDSHFEITRTSDGCRERDS